MWLLWLALLAHSSGLVHGQSLAGQSIAAPPLPAPSLLEQGDKALDAKQYDRAVQLYTQAAAADPKDYSAQFDLGLAYSFLGKDADAIAHYKAALELKPGLAEAELNLGLSYLRVKDPAAAQPYLEAALAAKLAAKSTATAESALGRAMARLGNPAAGEPHIRKAVAMDPTRRDDLLELASLYEAAKQPDKAIAIYREFPDRPQAQERLSVLLTGEGHGPEAIAALEAAVAQSPTDENRLALAQAYVTAKQLAKAEPIVAKLVALEPRDKETRLFYGKILRDEHKLPQAAMQFSILLESHPEVAESWTEYGNVLMAMEEYAQALDALDHVRALGAENAGHVFYRAVAYDHLKQRPEALESYRRFLTMAQGKFPNQEFQARQRARILEDELKRR
jgi:tetratricopeptide (TPR) repeat protein